MRSYAPTIWYECFGVQLLDHLCKEVAKLISDQREVPGPAERSKEPAGPRR